MDAQAGMDELRQASTQARGLRPWHLAALGLLLAVATGLRVHRLGASDLWLDELSSVQFAAGNAQRSVDLPGNAVIEHPPWLTRRRGESSWLGIIPGAVHDTHPPCYSLLLRGWQTVAGTTDVATRAFSVVASVLAIVFLFDAVRLLSGPAAALWACALMALAPPQIRYAQEARSYALALAEGMLACAALVRIEILGANWRRLTALGGAAFALLWTFYLAWAGATALGIYALLRLRGTARRRAVGALVVSLAVLLATWGPLMPRQLRHGTGSVSWLQTNPAGHLAMTFERLVTLPTRYFGEPPYDHDVAVRYLVCAAPLLMLRWRRDLVLWAVWAVAVVALPTAVDLVRSMKFLNWIRFTLAASPGMYALVAGAYVTGRSWLWQLVPAGLAVVCLQSLPQAYDRPPFEWRRTAEYVDQHAAAADLVVLCDVGDSPYQARALMVGLQHYMQTPLRPTVLLEGSPSAELAEQCAGFPVVWVLRTQSARIPDALAGRFDIAHVRDFQGVGRLYRLVPNGR